MEDNNLKAIAAAAVVVCAVSGLAYYLLRPEGRALGVPAAVSVPATAAPGATALPPLDQSDALARERLKALGTLPASWLSVDNVLRRLTAGAQIIADGGSPRDSLSFLAPSGRFQVFQEGGRVYADPKAYARYDALASAVASIDAKAAARLIEDLSPLFAQACAELDDKRCDFKGAVVRGAALLLAAPEPKGPVRLRRKVVTWAYADASLEALKPAQKHLLRLGPANGAKVRAKLRELSDALGAPANATMSAK